eukprot:SAG22_NODE_2518_length_2486_cov_2.823209_3_plen_78_part_00
MTMMITSATFVAVLSVLFCGATGAEETGGREMTWEQFEQRIELMWQLKPNVGKTVRQVNCGDADPTAATTWASCAAP